ncbi:P-loop containing nucleoside triphosphate hydrolase protein [Microdochium trichocladiopsis]|uniref:P-loop containing nucleoside triphosphate hydrolase protein n=1 Tax=Microdochium trichocladiopsis TaxID=1682393 RepID=A0A9P9BM78_9PEZI|nr:P-loop containing nucleoside triphosphate hydrolase protein [Microdochium trichocladiopsis]KAH7029318.1 P-loop containing nucleoside triphosphate hydrolase protein [Microdochium trichocladiopsis]
MSVDGEKDPSLAQPGDTGSTTDLEKNDAASAVTPLPDTTSPQQQNQSHLPLSTAALSLADVEPVDVQVRSLGVSVDTSPSILEPSTYPDLFRSKFGSGQGGPTTKHLLSSLDASLKPGTLTAIIGGSGSGKTTALNTIAERVASSRLSQSGRITFNGVEGVHHVRHAYVLQQDILLPTLTVRETLLYAARLRLPSPATHEDRVRIVEEVILELGLKDCANTRIGNSEHRGCSGGEKRRTSIGVQLLANPSVLFLDEPTTGLDATSAYLVVKTLKALANQGRTIVTTIHQPRSEIWDLFDNLLVLSRGSPVYSGSTKECVSYFASLGFQLPPFVNPAEFVIDQAAIDNRTPELEAESTERVQRLKAHWIDQAEKRFADLPSRTDEKGRLGKRAKISQSVGFVRQLTVLTDRTFKVTYRDPMGMAGALIQTVVMGVVMGYVFFALPSDLSGIRSRQGALYIALNLQPYLFLVFEIFRLTVDAPTFDRESSEGCVTALPFLLSRRLARMFTEDVPVCAIFSIIFYFMAGFEADASRFLQFFAVVLLNHYIIVMLAATAVSVVRNFAGAGLIANLAYTLQSMACGYFINVETLPVYVRWLKHITYMYYAFGGLCANEFEDSFYECPLEGGEANPGCVQYTGPYIMASLGFQEDWQVERFVILVAFVLFFTLLSWIGFGFLKVEMTIARARTSTKDLSVGREKMTARSIQQVRAIDVDLAGYSLAIKKRTALGRTLPTKVIVNPVTTTFQSGRLNVICGPSGSGKTSLLNACALRLKNSIGTRYETGGKLMFNGAVPHESVVRSVVSYVCQDDDALLPSLTVRETLRFSAGLRLPSFMSKEEKNRRAEEVLLKMGLKECANVLIGDDQVKGISGGEKRRVSIAVQILTDPRVLLLDEPTSGLDAFTAASIMEVLHGLANEGRTLILTIHQARSDLFTHFGNVLLLARGGQPAYAGPAKNMLAYFASHGYHCPEHTNPADYALDLITVDLQEESREAESRLRVNNMIEAWARADRDRWMSDKTPAAEPSSTTGGSATDNEPVDDPAAPPRSSLNRNGKSELATPAELGALVVQRASFTTALPLLFHRALINIRRQPPVMLARTMQVLGLGIVLTLFFSPLGYDFYSVQSRVGFIQEIGAFYFVGMLNNIAVYIAERDVFYREDDDGVYSIESFLTVYTILELPFEIVSSLIFAVLATFAVNLPRTVESHFSVALACFAIVSCGESLGIIFNTLSRHAGFAVNIVSTLLSVAQTMSGIMSIDMPRVFVIFNYLSPIKYATAFLMPYTLRGIDFTCEDSQRLPTTGQCPIETGDDVLELYKMTNDTPIVDVGTLLGLVVAYRVLAWAVLRIVRTRWKSLLHKQRASSLAAAAAPAAGAPSS